MLKILCVGPQWRGSNANGLFKSLQRVGNLIDIVDENYFIPLNNTQIFTKIISKLGRKLFIRDFNEAILKQYELFQPDLVLIYKGAFLLPETILEIKKKTIIVNFYPDVSFHTHGSLLVKTLPLYNHIFTTKTFGIEDMKSQLGITASSFIPHGYDPDIHLKLNLTQFPEEFACDASFIGTHSPYKEEMLTFLAEKHPEINLYIWGNGWNKANKKLSSAIKNKSITGDLYCLAINASRVNIGLLSEQVKGASSGDLITSRTFHIPGAGGCMLHQRTSESILYFEENQESFFFESKEEFAEKLIFLLKNDSIREQIANNGYSRAINNHSLNHRATQILEILFTKKLI